MPAAGLLSSPTYPQRAGSGGPASRAGQSGQDFKEAWLARDISALIGLLDPDATLTADGGGLVSATLDPIQGGERIAHYAVALARRAPDNVTLLERTVNGSTRPGGPARRHHGDGVRLRDHSRPDQAHLGDAQSREASALEDRLEPGAQRKARPASARPVAHPDEGGLTMATQQALDEAEIREVIDTLVESIRTADLDGLEACFAPDMVSFDVGPPLQHVGVHAKLKNWEEAFSVLHPPLGYEIHDLTITAGDHVAFAHGINRLSGTVNGRRFGPWVRWTAGLQKIDGHWLIAADQVSVPIDHARGTRCSISNLRV